MSYLAKLQGIEPAEVVQADHPGFIRLTGAKSGSPDQPPSKHIPHKYVTRKYKIGLLRQFADIQRLKRGANGLTAGEYYDYEVYRPDLTSHPDLAIRTNCQTLNSAHIVTVFVGGAQQVLYALWRIVEAKNMSAVSTMKTTWLAV